MQVLRIIGFSGVFFGVLFGLCVFPSQGWGTPYQHTDPPFSLNYDEANWEIIPLAKPAGQPAVDKTMAEKTLLNVQRKLADEKYHARFSVVIDEAKRFAEPGKPLLDSYRKHAVEFLLGQRFKVKPAETTKLPGISLPTFEIIGEQRDFGLTFRQVVFLDGDKAVLLTGATRKDKFETQSKELQELFASFKWGKK